MEVASRRHPMLKESYLPAMREETARLPMKTTIKDNVLHIEIPLHAPRPSATGKTLTVASSNGNKETEASVNGLPVIVGVNAYIKPL